MRIWSPRGQTPVLPETSNWQSLSIIGGITSRSFCFHIYAGGIKSQQVVEFLRALLRHRKGARLLVVWDGAPIHRSRAVSAFIDSTHGGIAVERLSAYSPELNPAEYLWAHLKQHETGNLIVREAWQLSLQARAALRRMRRRHRILTACFAHAELWP